jgi:hypothetical protein
MMNRSRFSYFLALAAMCAGCASFPSNDLGHFDLLAIGAGVSQGTILATNVEGKHCQVGSSIDYGAALDDALAKVSGANALANAEFAIRLTSPLNLCTEVRGQAVRIP